MKGEMDLGKLFLGVVAVIGIAALFTGGDLSKITNWLTTPSGEETQQVIREREIVREIPTTGTVKQKLPIETLKASAKDKYTMAAIDATRGILFYEVGADVSDPYVKPLDYISISSGTGSTTNMIIQTNSDYDVYFNGSSSYYDEFIDNWEINYNPDTGKGYILFDEKSYYPAVSVGAFVDVDTLPETESGGVWNDTGTDTIKYDKSAGGGTGWIKMDIGNANSNSELHDVVMCFLDSDSDLEGDEVTGITASYVSGTSEIKIPGDLTTYWTDAAGTGAASCFKIANVLGNAEKARWQFTITFNENNFDTGEEFEICFDDLGDYKAKQYPSRNAKASAECLTIGVQA